MHGSEALRNETGGTGSAAKEETGKRTCEVEKTRPEQWEPPQRGPSFSSRCLAITWDLAPC